jgi:hypothetical protein
MASVVNCVFEDCVEVLINALAKALAFSTMIFEGVWVLTELLVEDATRVLLEDFKI